MSDWLVSPAPHKSVGVSNKNRKWKFEMFFGPTTTAAWRKGGKKTPDDDWPWWRMMLLISLIGALLPFRPTCGCLAQTNRGLMRCTNRHALTQIAIETHSISNRWKKQAANEFGSFEQTKKMDLMLFFFLLILFDDHRQYRRARCQQQQRERGGSYD